MIRNFVNPFLNLKAKGRSVFDSAFCLRGDSILYHQMIRNYRYPAMVSLINLSYKKHRYCKRLTSRTPSNFLGYHFDICTPIWCSFPRELYFRKLFIRYAQFTLWLNCSGYVYKTEHPSKKLICRYTIESFSACMIILEII
jgi:hypothetical protein